MALAHKLVGNAMQMAVCQLGGGPDRLLRGQASSVEDGQRLGGTRLTKPQGNQQGAPASAGGLFQKALDVGKRVSRR